MNTTLLYSDVGTPLDLENAKKGLIYRINDLYFKKKETLDKFCEILNEKHKITVYERNGLISGGEIVGETVLISYSYDDEMYSCWGKCDSYETIDYIYKLYNDVTKNEQDELNILLISYYIKDNILMFSENLLQEDFKPKKSYVPYINTDEMFNQFFNSDENILFLVGKTGTGKSKLSTLCIKWISDTMKEKTNRVVTVNNADILAREDFWQSIKNLDVKLVLIDDLDFMLNPRKNDEKTMTDVTKNKFLSYFLTHTDGFRKNKIKFIITTNQEYNDIDDALLRKGRMFDILELRNLTLDECKEIWKEEGLTDYPFKKSMSVAELAYEIEHTKNKHIFKEYLKDKTVSKKSKDNRKIGF